MTDDPLQQLAAAAAEQVAQDPNAERRRDLRSRLYTAAELCAIKTTAAEPLCGPFVRRKWRTLVVGHSGEGKTLVTTTIAGALATGGKFLGYRATQCKVLYIDLEQDESMAQERVGGVLLGNAFDADNLASLMDAMPEAHTNLHYCQWMEGISLDEQSADRDELRSIIEDLRPDVVVVDPLYKSFLGNPNEPVLATMVMRFLDALREDYGFALVIPMHPRKEQQGVTTKRLTKHDAYGGGGWIWGAEMILGIERMPGSTARLSFFKDRSGAIDPDTQWMLAYDKTQGFTRVRSIDPTGPSTTEEMILAILREHPGEFFDRAQLQEMLPGDRGERTVRNAISALRRDKSSGKYPRLTFKPGAHGALHLRWEPPKGADERVRDMESKLMEIFDAEEDHDE